MSEVSFLISKASRAQENAAYGAGGITAATGLTAAARDLRQARMHQRHDKVNRRLSSLYLGYAPRMESWSREGKTPYSVEAADRSAKNARIAGTRYGEAAEESYKQGKRLMGRAKRRAGISLGAGVALVGAGVASQMKERR